MDDSHNQRNGEYGKDEEVEERVVAFVIRKIPRGFGHRIDSFEILPIIAYAPPSHFSKASVQMETDFDVDLNGHRMAIQHRGFEFPLRNCLDRFLIKAHAYRTYYTDLARPSIGPDYDPEQYCSLKLGVASFFGIIRIGIVNSLRCRYPTAHPKRAPTSTSARPETKAWPLSAANSSVIAAPDPATTSCSIRGWLKNRREWITDLRRGRGGQFGRPRNCRIRRKLGLFIAYHDCRRRYLLSRETRQAAF